MLSAAETRTQTPLTKRSTVSPNVTMRRDAELPGAESSRIASSTWRSPGKETGVKRTRPLSSLKVTTRGYPTGAVTSEARPWASILSSTLKS